MFGSIFDAIVDVTEKTVEAAASTVGHTFGLAADVLSGDGITKARLGALLAAGLTIYQISDITGVATDVIKSMIDEDN